jgi:hypothetical protein
LAFNIAVHGLASPFPCRRTENLAARTERKIDKKRQSREKKLLRAGFEGRREGFIGSSSKKPAS